MAASPKKRRWFGKLIVGVVALLLVAGAVGRWQPSGQQTPTPDTSGRGRTIATTVAPRATTLAQIQPTLAARPPGFVAAPWTTTLPTGVVQGTIDAVIDGDTFEIVVDGVSARYRIYHADTPETYPDPECGGAEATQFSRSALWSSDTPGRVWVESVDQRDRYGRKLAYLWFTVGGQPVLLNHVLINSGWAEDIDYGDAFNPYRDQLSQAETFAYTNKLGVWGLCGGFGIPAGSKLAQATSVSTLEKLQQPAANLSAACNPNYSPCVPNVPYDLDCKDIGFPVQVIGSDPYNLDNDDPDLIGCESW